MSRRLQGPAPLVVVTGTGTGIGKTVLACALVDAWGRRGVRVAGLKPLESGVVVGALDGSDSDLLGRMSTFHVKRFSPPYLLARAVSPHRAAREEGVSIDLPAIVSYTRTVRGGADGVVLETAGGLFSPLTDHTTNADLVRQLEADVVLLVAPDRLGALHDVGAAVRAAWAEGVALTGIVLSTPETADASTGTNAEELARVIPTVPVLATLPRAPVQELSAGPVAALVRRLFA